MLLVPQYWHYNRICQIQFVLQQQRSVGWTHCTYLNGNLVSIPEAFTSDLERLLGAAKGLLGSIFSRVSELPLAKLRQTQARAGGFPKEQAQSKSGTGLGKAVGTVLQSGGILLSINLIHINFRGSLVLAVIILGKEELGEADLLLTSAHLGHGSLGSAGEQIGLEGLEVLILSASASLHAVLEINEERKIGNSAIIVSITSEDLESTSGKSGLVKGLGRAKLYEGQIYDIGLKYFTSKRKFMSVFCDEQMDELSRPWYLVNIRFLIHREI